MGDDVVYNDEKPALRQLINVYEKNGASVLGVQEVPHEKVSSYGIVATRGTSDPADMVEKPPVDEAPSNMAVLGRYIITPEIFEILERTDPGAGGEIQLTDGLRALLKIQPIYAYNFEGRRYDVGDKQGFLEASVEYALRRPELRDGFLKYLNAIVEKEK